LDGILDEILEEVLETDTFEVEVLTEVDSFSGLEELEFLREESRLKAAPIWSMEMVLLNILTVCSGRSNGGLMWDGWRENDGVVVESTVRVGGDGAEEWWIARELRIAWPRELF
jgi:hypothetical protein